MFKAEKRWLVALLQAMIRGGWNSTEEFVDRLLFSAPPLFVFGLRAATLLLTWSPILLFRPPFHQQAREKQDAYLESLDNSSIYLLRQLITAIKVAACFGYFENNTSIKPNAKNRRK